MPLDLTLGEISSALSKRMGDLVEALDLVGSRLGAEFVALNPTRADNKAGSFAINLNSGRWGDFASNDTGDALGLVAYVKFGDARSKEALREAARWSRRWLGLPEGEFRGAGTKKLEAARETMDAREAQARADAALELSRKRGSAFRDWLDAAPILPPDGLRPASAAWRYLVETRGLPVEQLARFPSAVRWKGAQRHVETDRIVPALVSAMFLGDGACAAIHRVFLEPDGGTFAGEPRKKIWPGGYLGAFIPISRGFSGWSVAKAAAGGVRDTLCYCEGVEDGFTIALLAPEWRVYAVGTARNFAAQVPPECAAQVVVAVDNDGNAKAREAVARHLAALRATCAERGVGYGETRARGGKDFNDMVREAG